MALELKGLKANMLRLQATVGELNSIAVEAVEKGDALKSHLGDIRGQIGAHVDDIEFAANVLGNSSGESEKLVEKPKADHVVNAAQGNMTNLDLGQAAQQPQPDGRTFQRIG